MKIKVTDRILLFGDRHFPAVHPDYLAFCAAVRDAYCTDTFISVGDDVDFHAISYHESDPDLPSSGDELEEVQQCVSAWADEFPEQYSVFGNHGMLPQRKAKTYGLPKAFIRGFNDIVGAPDSWVWAPKSLEFNLKCGMPVMVVHAAAGSLTAGANKLKTCSLVQGHYHHLGGVQWSYAPQWTLFFLSVGCGVDPKHDAMAYGADPLKIPSIGCGVIIEGYAAHIPMWLDKRGRWTGKVP